MVSQRTQKVWQQGGSLALVIPKEWARGMEIEAGDQVDLTYNGILSVSKKTADPEAR